MKAIILKALLGAVGPLLLAILDAFQRRDVFNDAVTFARTQVARLASSGLDNAAKRDAAAKAVKADLRAVGKDIADHLLNLAIEIAYSALKAKV